MNTAWSPAKAIKFRALEGNLFTVQCSCLGDWLKVTKEGPWLFRQNAVVIEPYDGLCSPDSINLNFIDVWLQVHKLPDGYRKKSLITNLVEKKVGKVSEVETDLAGVGNFVRVRVKIDVRNPLARFVTISRGGQREFYKIQFEKFPKFCGACGMLGHTHLECGTGEHDLTKLKWGDFLKADRETWRGRRVLMGGRGDGWSGRRGRRDVGGRGRGRGEYYDWRIHPERGDKTNPALEDSATDVNMTDTEKNAKKRLNLDDQDLPPQSAAIEAGTLMITDGQGINNSIAEDMLTDKLQNVKDNNKRQKGDSQNSQAFTNSESAGSLEGCRREQ
jgi:hypothetical protein